MVLELGLAICAIAGWFALFGACLLRTRPRPVTPVAPTRDFGGDEPPAVVSLLAHGWKHTDAAARSTLLDLAARRLVELRQPGGDPAQTTIHVPRPGKDDDAGLTAYERRVLDRVRGLAAGGVLPLTALTFRDPEQAKAWSRRLKAEVIADARTRGLTRRRFSSRTRSVLTAAAIVATLAVLVAMLHHGHRTHPGPGPALAATIPTFLVLVALANLPLGERDTPAGRAAAARWLGLRDFLRGDEAFAALPPAAVAVWDRYLPYGGALGVTHVCDEAVDLGMGDRTLVWSSFGGTWHQVRVRYPRLWGRYGKEALPLAASATGCLVAGVALLYYRGRAVDGLVGELHGLFWLASLLGGLYLAGRGAYRLLRAAVDVSSPVTVTGEVLWDAPWRMKSVNEDESVPWLYYLAVDDGQTDGSPYPRTTAWGVPRELWDRYQVGDVIRLTARPWTRRVLDVAVVEKGRARQLLEPTTDDATERLIAEAMGVATPGWRPEAGADVPPAGELLTVDEVSRAVGRQVTVAQSPIAPRSMSIRLFEADGRRAALVVVGRGLAGRLAMRRHRGGAPLPGIGDEAYQGDRWAIARSGDLVVSVRAEGRAELPHPGNLPWLLSTAVSRLPDDQPRRDPSSFSAP
ncbi:DUF2207 domain-containing protein [Frankia sp. CNm7]|uniref:DUF2207 domain-containing protein n=1 Tax=Frankia nepalensis TaxID=1836974 RepID=A0A937UMJ5_9ACTN|nr:DUF2207 domain-containing protein [Frankia nepalensis]MBL7498356.1 DUF2207 domain-containing protein [Frankia nepalensis]MBL7513235.1 DUF2207 domain-containing protein [Frankia nepalensis]MBL7524066.1 DUF2207 domain-containing protein [Frankia nepalensis]MBL7628919.1 DUF2207 domain-containing protein [Frankia nepalensis]